MKLAALVALADEIESIAPQKRGAWIETGIASMFTGGGSASLPRNGERGLKQTEQAARATADAGIAPQKRGAWIETNR